MAQPVSAAFVCLYPDRIASGFTATGLNGDRGNSRANPASCSRQNPVFAHDELLNSTPLGRIGSENAELPVHRGYCREHW